MFVRGQDDSVRYLSTTCDNRRDQLAGRRPRANMGRRARKAAAVVVHILCSCIRGLQWKPQDRLLAMEVRTNANKLEDSPGGAEICANRMSPVQCLVIVGSLPSMRSTQAEFE